MGKTLSGLLYDLESRQRALYYDRTELAKSAAAHSQTTEEVVSAMIAAGAVCVFNGDQIYQVINGSLVVRECRYASEVALPEPADAGPIGPAWTSPEGLAEANRIDRDTDRDSRSAELPRVSPPFRCDCPECEDTAYTPVVLAPPDDEVG